MTTFNTIGIVGAGAMGRGIAQIAVQAGSTVKLFDMQGAAIEAARTSVGEQWDKLQAKGKIDAGKVESYKKRLVAAGALSDLADCDCVIEAVVERLDVKQKLFAELEGIVQPSALLATNTS